MKSALGINRPLDKNLRNKMNYNKNHYQPDELENWNRYHRGKQLKEQSSLKSLDFKKENLEKHTEKPEKKPSKVSWV